MDYPTFLVVYFFSFALGCIAGISIALEMMDRRRELPIHPAAIARELMAESREEEPRFWWCWRCELPQGGKKSENGLCLKCSFNDQQEQRVSA